MSASTPAWRVRVLLAIYALINIPFVYKYTERAAGLGAYAVAGYGVFLVILMWAVQWAGASRWKNALTARRLWLVAAVLTCLLAALMLQFDPAEIRVSRSTALTEWISRLLEGQFPFASSSAPSGFPFLFLMALPAYLLGDVGWLQIAVLGALVALFLGASRDQPSRAWGALLLLITAPVYGYETVVRSELTTNMVAVLAWLVWLERAHSQPRHRVLLGIIGGLLLSTRGIVIVIYALAIPALFRSDWSSAAKMVGIVLAVFLATLVPFLIWDAPAFLRYGPFAIQMSYVPAPLLAGTLLTAAWLGLRCRTVEEMYFRLPLVLFGVILILFLVTVAQRGWLKATTGDGFDISYFIFALPFLLYFFARFPQVRVRHHSQTA